MVDVSQKNETERFALASGIISVSGEVMEAIQKDAVPKGNVLATVQSNNLKTFCFSVPCLISLDPKRS